MEKSIDEMDYFTGALLDMTIQQTIKCEFNWSCVGKILLMQV